MAVLYAMLSGYSYIPYDVEGGTHAVKHAVRTLSKIPNILWVTEGYRYTGTGT